MDYFAEERMKAAEEVICRLPDTIYSAANFAGSLSREQVKEYRQAVKHLTLTKDSKLHRAFRNIVKLGMHTLKKAAVSIEKKGFKLCQGESGCNQCCRRLVLVPSKAEQAAIINEIRFMPAQTKQQLVSNFYLREPKWRGALLTFGLSNEEHAGDLWENVGACFAEIGGLCPAVGPTGSCMIYAARPWSCRTYRTIGGVCVPGRRFNIAKFSDIEAAIQDLLTKSGEINMSIFPVIRQALEL